MEELELNNELLNSIRSWMLAKNYPYNTLRTYGYTLGKIFREHKVLNKEVVNKLLSEFKHQNQRAVLVLIRKYCYDNDIDFKIILPSVKRSKKSITIKTVPLSEIDIMIASAPKPYDLMIKCIFKIGGGLRISEAIKLSWNHFRWSLWLKEGGNGGVEIKKSKGDERFITVPEALMQELYDYAKQKSILNEFGIPVGGMLFDFDKHYTSKFEEELKKYDIEKWKVKYIEHAYHWFRHNILQKYCEKALGHPVRIHSLRHTRATQLYDEKDIPIEIIQKLLGHKEITTTMIYTEVSNKKVFNAMKGID